MESKMQIFDSAQFGRIRTFDVKGNPWFVGRDVAVALGYKETAKAVREKVDIEDKGVSEIDTPGGKQQITIINESGLYSLIMSSKLPSANESRKRPPMGGIHGGAKTEMSHPTTYAVDFDGTLCENAYPEIGAPNLPLIDKLISRRRLGAKVILWTCREGELLTRAVEFCRCYGLEFDAVNDNTEELKRAYGTNPRKIGADYYIDDKAMPPDLFVS